MTKRKNKRIGKKLIIMVEKTVVDKKPDYLIGFQKRTVHQLNTEESNLNSFTNLIEGFRMDEFTKHAQHNK